MVSSSARLSRFGLVLCVCHVRQKVVRMHGLSEIVVYTYMLVS